MTVSHTRSAFWKHHPSHPSDRNPVLEVRLRAIVHCADFGRLGCAKASLCQFWKNRDKCMAPRETSNIWIEKFQYGRRQWVLVLSDLRNSGCLNFCAPPRTSVFIPPPEHKNASSLCSVDLRELTPVAGAHIGTFRSKYWDFKKTVSLCPESRQTRPQPVLAPCHRRERRWCAACCPRR
jgi:hypothetical protein